MTSTLEIYTSSDTVQDIVNQSSRCLMIWTPPEQPMPYTQPKPREVRPPNLSAARTTPPFQGHKFRIGGSKK
jgi:hypothetical protein